MARSFLLAAVAAALFANSGATSPEVFVNRQLRAAQGVVPAADSGLEGCVFKLFDKAAVEVKAKAGYTYSLTQSDPVGPITFDLKDDKNTKVQTILFDDSATIAVRQRGPSDKAGKTKVFVKVTSATDAKRPPFVEILCKAEAANVNYKFTNALFKQDVVSKFTHADPRAVNLLTFVDSGTDKTDTRTIQINAKNVYGSAPPAAESSSSESESEGSGSASSAA